MTTTSVSEIVQYLKDKNTGFELHGDNSFEIIGYSSISNIQNSMISWIKDIDNFNLNQLNDIEHSLIITTKPLEDIGNSRLAFIYCENPKQIYFDLLKEFWPIKPLPPGQFQNSIVETTNIGHGVHIGRNTYIGPDVIIGDNVTVKNNVSIEGVVTIGSGTIIHSGVIIGTDGYGYYQDENGVNQKVPHYGGVSIGNDVEIGANVCIDRGTLDNTVIGNNVKIDNLCHIAHNVIIHDNASVIALSMLGGSSVLEDNAYIAPGALIMNQLHVGKDALVGMGAVVTKNVEENTVVAGVPAKPLRKNKGE